MYKNGIQFMHARSGCLAVGCLVLSLFVQPQVAWAVQAHGGAEGLVSQQLGHLLLVISFATLGGSTMIVSWQPVVWVDIVGSAAVVLLALKCSQYAFRWMRDRPEDTFRFYLFLMTSSFVFFAFSRSVGHLVKQALLFEERTSAWQNLAPFSGAINTAIFIVIFAFSIYLNRSRKVHLEIQLHREHLEAMVKERTLELQKALAEVKVLSGFLPICASCKKIRNDQGYWSQIEEYIRDHSEAEFTHSICPGCFGKLYPELVDKDKN
jgi:hypothetical protein